MRCACNPVGAAATRTASWGRAFPIRREYAYKECEHATIARAMRKMAVLTARYTSVSVRAFHDSASENRTSIERTSDEYLSDGAVLCPWWIRHCHLEAAMRRAARLLDLALTRCGLPSVAQASWGGLT